MTCVRIGTVTGLALLALAPSVRGQTGFDELTGILTVTGDAASIEADGQTQLIYVPPQTGVDLDDLLAETAANLRPLNGRRVHAVGEFRDGILWNARVEEAEEEATAVITQLGPAPTLDERIGVLQVTATEATIDGGIRLIYVPPQRGVAVGPLLAQTAANVRPFAGQRVRVIGELQGDILWNAQIEELVEEEVEDGVQEEVQEEVLEEENVEQQPGEEGPVEQGPAEEAEPVEPY